MKIVVLSGLTLEPDVRELVDGYLPKPTAPLRLAKLVRTLARP